MPKIRPTFRNIVFFAIAYQLYPAILYFLVQLANPDPKPWAAFAIFGIAEVLLLIVILGWKRNAETEVVDERELICLIVPPAVLTEAFANWHYRR